MSVYQDITSIGVIGTKENIIRMLNAAICNLGADEVLNVEDSLDTINHKIMADSKDYCIMVRIPDLLDEECWQDNELMEKKHAYDTLMENCRSCTRECQADDCPWDGDPDECPKYGEYNTAFRGIEIVRVELGKTDYAAKFSLYEYECYYYNDWLYWDEIARLYNCRIFIDDRLYINGEFERFCSVIAFEPIDETVKKTVIELEEIEYEKYNYDTFYDKLVALCPERYQPLRDEYLQLMEKEVKKNEGEKFQEDKHTVVENA